ncbi:MAG TPA: type II toxin-antitoxin system VapC family toxin [Longimicrobium sp.]|jgi:predicted nucleic acid-binding protein
MLPSVYIETTVVSYLVARPSRDPVMAARQRKTRDWWENRRGEYRLFTSQTTVAEAACGEAAMARRRLAALNGIPVYAILPDVSELGRALIARGPLPANAEADAYHIAFAARHHLDLLLTWNCKHIANPRMYPKIKRVCDEYGFELPAIRTPDELLRR